MVQNAGLFLGRMGLFVLIGIAVAVVGEIQYSVFIRGDTANLVGSIGFNALYLTLAYLLTRVLLRAFGKRPWTAILLMALAGLAGLMVEWFMIGNSPWGNPDAVQIGMFAYWACMVLVPVVLLDEEAGTRPWRRRVLVTALIYTLLALAAQLLPWPVARYVYHIWSVVFGYLVLMVLCVTGLVLSWRMRQAEPA